jgi:hypothetical protein
VIDFGGRYWEKKKQKVVFDQLPFVINFHGIFHGARKYEFAFVVHIAQICSWT